MSPLYFIGDACMRFSFIPFRVSSQVGCSIIIVFNESVSRPEVGHDKGYENRAIHDCHTVFPSSKGQWTLAFRSDDESPGSSTPATASEPPMSFPFLHNQENISRDRPGDIDYTAQSIPKKPPLITRKFTFSFRYFYEIKHFFLFPRQPVTSHWQPLCICDVM